MITINFFTTLRIFLKTEQVKVQTTQVNMKELLQKCEEQISKRFLHKLLDPAGKIMPGTMILINGQNVLHLNGLNTVVKGGDVVALFPPGGGG